MVTPSQEPNVSRPTVDLAADLLERVTDHFIEHGVGDASLRPLAASLGMSTYKLLYHFGSKEELIRRAVLRASERQVEEIRKWIRVSPSATVGDIMNAYWNWFLDARNQRTTRLLFETGGMALRASSMVPNALEPLLLGGIDLEEEILASAGIPRKERRALATLICSACWGLQFDLLATGDDVRTTAAWRLFARDVDERIERIKTGGAAM